jgi:hypothetical protein
MIVYVANWLPFFVKDVPGAELKSCAARDVQKAKQRLGRWKS